MIAPTLHGKVALVTGAGMGMGAATAELFARSGARVVVADLDAEAGRRTVDGLTAEGHIACFVKVDVSTSKEVEAMVDSVVDTYGRLDVAVNNAAITPDDAPLDELDEDYWDRLMSVNLRGVALCLKYEIRHLIRQGTGGSIVNVSSVRGFRPKANAAAYVAAKHGVVGLTKVAALENGPRNIRVNGVAPGAIDTPMLRSSMARHGTTVEDLAPQMGLLNRLGTAEEVAQATLWLASDQSSYVTGTTVHVDAGYTSR
ncbi:SDR family NAD(P)-dependent oxidoreductase [Microbacterium sp. A93]|uniref:SDR family NAD(P)-dependent oxidoreductase n=1 Tax=Microbacterium sp. A93 TaxID=3450716 RepID=UPI003F431082